MSIEGVSDDLSENSGRIKFLNIAGDSTIINSDDINNTFIIMGNNTEDSVNESGLVNVYRGENGTVVDESSLIYSDLKSVEEWLQRRTDLNSMCFDLPQSEDNSFSVENSTQCLAVDLNNLECEDQDEGPEISQTVHFLSDNEGPKYNILWENTNTEVSKLFAESSVVGRNGQQFLIVPESSSSSSEQNISKASFEKETTRTLSTSDIGHIQVITTPIKSLNNNVSVNSLKNVDTLQCQSLNNDKQNNVSIVLNPNKKLPLIRVSKSCLSKGKLLGKKTELSLLVNKDVNILANSTLHYYKSKLSTITQISDAIAQLSHSTSINEQISTVKVKRKKQGCTKDDSCKGNYNTDLPVNAIRKVSKNSLLKINQPKNLLKSKSSITTEEPETESSFNESNVVTYPNKNERLPPIALVAISTDKTDDTTEIRIKTDGEENVLVGKSSEIMKATGSQVTKPLKSKIKDKKNKKRNNPPTRNQDESVINDLLTKVLGVDKDMLETLETNLSCFVEGCDFVTTKGSWLKTHMLQHYDIRPYQCDYPDCTWSFYTSFRLKRHQLIHMHKKDFQCPVKGCDRSFSTIYNLNNHKKLHNRPTLLVCSVEGCDQAFQTRKRFEEHLRVHGEEFAGYVCPKEGCGKKYFTINSLNSHSRSHQHSEEELKCSYCNKIFDVPCRLKAHINQHIGVKPYKCEFEGCMWSFLTSSKLRRHQRKHTQVRKHTCQVCGKSFLRSDHLKDHALKHFIKKSFVCPIADCGAVLLNKSSMYAHLKKHRTQEAKATDSNQTYPCPMEGCNIAFNTKKHLRTHMHLMHVANNLLADSNSQDTIQMLSDENLITFESMQNNSSNSGTGGVGFNSMAQEGLLVGMSDLVQCIPAIEQGEFAEPTSSGDKITHVVFTDEADPEKDSVALEGSQTLTEIEDEIGSARTGITYQEAVGSKKQVAEYEIECLPAEGDTMSVAVGLHSASDVVLSAGLLASQDNLERSGLLLQDELSSNDLYGMGGTAAEEGLLGPGGELQVLLLDPSTRLQHSDFEQSTINLRDLE